MTAPMHHADAWESFWRAAPTTAGSVLWDASAQFTAALHLPLLAAHTSGGVPLVDVGCGNGTQTRFLAGRYGRVVGVDVSGEAVSRALSGPGTAAEFRSLDAAEPGPVQRLHAELGDSDVYLRGVLHQCTPQDRVRMARSVATLAGTAGRALVVEPAEGAKHVLAELMARPEGPPPELTAVFRHGIAPMEMADDEVPALFTEAGLHILASGAMPLTLTLLDAGGAPVALPANWLVVGRSQ